MIRFGTKSVTLSMLIDLLTSTCRSTQVKIASTDLWPQEMFTFLEMLALVESESSFGAYVCHRHGCSMHGMPFHLQQWRPGPFLTATRKYSIPGDVWAGPKRCQPALLFMWQWTPFQLVQVGWWLSVLVTSYRNVHQVLRNHCGVIGGALERERRKKVGAFVRSRASLRASHCRF